MKATNHFKNTIKTYLDNRAETDVLFSLQYSKPEKNLEDCITYILNTVHQSGCNGFADDEIFGMAVHYYDEDNIEVGKSMNAHVAVNHVVELTAEEKEQARKDAIQKAQEEAYRKATQPKKSKKAELNVNAQPSLFNF